jgi:NAD(P)-dependent dehydrogenase (short-subunit alcohol dehydrogenase family)
MTFLITASTGIGAATARRLAASGARVFIVSRTEDNCRSLTEALCGQGADASYFAGDLTNPDTAVASVRACLEKYGRLDGLFNVAGISGRKYGDGPVHECTEEGWAKTIEANLTTQYRMCREAIGVMLGQAPGANGQRGVVLNMASVLGLDPEPKHFRTIAYAASKGAIISMSRSMAALYAPEKIRVNVIAPALVQTPMSARASEDAEVVEFIRQKQPLAGGMIDVEHVASVCAFLLSDASQAMTGEVVKVDGGWCVS